MIVTQLDITLIGDSRWTSFAWPISTLVPPFILEAVLIEVQACCLFDGSGSRRETKGTPKGHQSESEAKEPRSQASRCHREAACIFFGGARRSEIFLRLVPQGLLHPGPDPKSRAPMTFEGGLGGWGRRRGIGGLMTDGLAFHCLILESPKVAIDSMELRKALEGEIAQGFAEFGRWHTLAL